MTGDDDQRAQKLLRVLKKRVRDGIDDVSPAVEKALCACCVGTPVSALLQSTFASLGSVFLTSASALLREQARLTESLLIASPIHAQSPQQRQQQERRRRWVRAVLAVTSVTDAVLSHPTLAGQDGGVMCCATSCTVPSPLTLQIRLRPVPHPPYLPPRRCRDGATECLSALHQRSAQDALDLCHASIVARETAFLADLAALLRRLHALYTLNKGVSTRPPQLAGGATGSTPLSLEVPLYVATVVAPDTAETRLAQLTAFTSGFMSICVTSQPSRASLLLRHATYALQTLWWLVQEGGMTRGRLAALETYVQALHDVDAMTETAALQSHSQLMMVMAKPVESDAWTSPIFVPPSLIVHCARGVSRSPSIVMLFFLQTLKPLLRQLWQEQQRHRTADDRSGTGLSLLTLLDALRTARPSVNPNLVFMVELHATWRREIESTA